MSQTSDSVFRTISCNSFLQGRFRGNSFDSWSSGSYHHHCKQLEVSLRTVHFTSKRSEFWLGLCLNHLITLTFSNSRWNLPLMCRNVEQCVIKETFNSFHIGPGVAWRHFYFRNNRICMVRHNLCAFNNELFQELKGTHGIFHSCHVHNVWTTKTDTALWLLQTPFTVVIIPSVFLSRVGFAQTKPPTGVIVLRIKNAQSHETSRPSFTYRYEERRL